MIPEFSDSGVSGATSKLLASYFIDASKRLKSMILKPTGVKASSKEFRAARASALIGQVDDTLRQLKAKTSGWVGAKMPEAYRQGKIRADQQAKEAGVRVAGSGMSGSFSVIDQRAVIVLARDASADLNKAADSMGERASRLLRQTAQIGLDEADINKILAGGLIDGQPVETIRQLREELRRVHGDQVQVIDKNGDPINFDVGYYASMVARTKTREANVTARHERLAELDIDLVAIIGRVSKNFCTAFLGQVFSLSGKSKKYPAYDRLPQGGPPFHPNCTKSTRPFIETLAEPGQLKDAQILPDAKKLLGMDSSKAQKAFSDLQIQSQIKDRYADTEKKLFTPTREMKPQAKPTPGVSDKTAALLAKLEKAKASRVAAEQRLAQVRSEVTTLQTALQAAVASRREAEIEAIKRKIAAAEAVAKKYDSAVKRAEKNN